ncbi:MAG TPA: hypothetical protein VF982_03650 [Anaerolineales bacterium]
MQQLDGSEGSTTSPRDALLAGAMVLLVALMSLSSSLSSYYLPPATGEVGVIFPPWMDQAEAFGAIIDAGGLVGSTGRLPNIIVAVADNSDFARRVVNNGAWVVTAARGLCGPQQEVARDT